MAHRHASFGKKIDNVRWTLSSGFFSAISAGTFALAFLADSSTPETLMRMRGRVLTFLEGALAPGGQVRVTMGIIKVPDGTGTTVLFDPVTDAAAPWIWYDVMNLGYSEYVTDVIASTEAAQGRMIVDNKAMRRIRPDEEVQIVVTNTTVDQAASVNVSYAIRTLLGS